MQSTRLIAGAMSGTSADGVDVAIVRIAGAGPDMSATLLAHHHRPFDAALRGRVLSMRMAGTARLEDLAQLGRDLALVYSAAVNETLLGAGLSAGDLAAVAAHGQTLFHAPPLTIQWIDPALLAAEVGCRVISDFRRADCAAGGQGAPLVPFADYVLFRDSRKSRVVLNIGGIANLTYLPAGGGLERVVAFDTGPGNCISDWLCRRHSPQGPGFDADGAEAAAGKAIGSVVQAALAQPYFAKSPPKSTDGPAMIGLFDAAASGQPQPALEDLLATACQLTARSIALAVERFLPSRPHELIASGGGMENATMRAMLQQALGPVPVRRTDELGMPSAAREAAAFALLGAATLDGLPANVPSATGARRAVVLGAITPPPR